MSNKKIRIIQVGKIIENNIKPVKEIFNFQSTILAQLNFPMSHKGTEGAKFFLCVLGDFVVKEVAAK
jgi:hypothetical protein